MLKKYLVILGKVWFIISAFLGIATATESNLFQEGEHYIKISAFSKQYDQTHSAIATINYPEEPQIMVFFNYGCYGCWIMNKRFADWVKLNPKNININYYPVAFNKIWEDLAKLYYVNKELKVYSDEEVFNQIHGSIRKPLWVTTEMIEFYGRKKINKEHLLDLFNSFDIARKVKISGDLAKTFNINLTPNVVIKFKHNSYMVNLSTVEDIDTLFKVLEYLIKVKN